MSDGNLSRDPIEELAEAYLERYRRGERPPLTEYVRLHPELADDIRDLFPALVMLEEAGLPSSAPERQPDDLPERLGDYRILREIGRGGMGVVYEAEQMALGRYVALKVLPSPAARDATRLLRFRREARAAARLHHSNIVPVFDVGEHQGQPYYAMQYIPGESLAGVMHELVRMRGSSPSPAVHNLGPTETEVREDGLSARLARNLLTGEPTLPPTLRQPGPLSRTAAADPGPAAAGRNGLSDWSRSSRACYYQSAARIGLQVAEALAYAHAHKVLHRDIKPANLLLDLQGTIWVADFGLAKEEGDDLTRSGVVVGTLRYIAPERLSGVTDARGDVYSLGVTLYELLTLQPAFPEQDRAALIKKVAHDEPPRPRRLDRHLPRDLETIVLKAMAKEPARRYQTADELVEDLRRFLTDRPIQARRTRPWELAWRWGRRNPLTAALAAAASLSLVLGTAFAWYYALRAEDGERKAHKEAQEAAREKDLAERHLYAAKMQLAQKAWAEPRFDRVRDLLEELRPGPGETDRRGFEWHLLYRLSHAEEASFRADGASPTVNVAISPDGTRVAAYSSWSRGFAVGGAVRVWDVRTGTLVATLEAPNASPRALRFSPDGRKLVAAAGSTTDIARGGAAIEGIKVWDLESGREVFTARSTNGCRAPSFSPDSKLLAFAGAPGPVEVWDLAGHRLLASAADAWPVKALFFTPDGRRLMGLSGRGLFPVWDEKTGTLPGPEVKKNGGLSLPTSIALSPDGQRYALNAGFGGFTVRDGTGAVLWNRPSTEVARFESERLAFGPDGKALAVGGADTRVVVWDVDSQSQRLVLSGHSSPVTAVAFSANGKRLVSGAGDEVKIWDLTREKNPRRIMGHIRPAVKVALSRDGRRLATSAGGIRPGQFLADPDKDFWFDGEVRVWDLATGRRLLNLRGHPLQAAGVAFSPDGRYLASGAGLPESRDVPDGKPDPNRGRWSGGEVKVWDLATGEAAFTLAGHPALVTGAAYSPDGRLLASGSEDGTVMLWDAKGRRPIHTWKEHAAAVESLFFSENGGRLAAIGADGTVHAWDTTTGLADASLPDLPAARWIAFGPDLAHLVGTGAGAELTVVPCTDRGPPRVLKGHTGFVAFAIFSADGRRLISGDSAGTVKFWDTQTWQEVFTMKAIPMQAPGQAALTAAGDRLILAGAERLGPPLRAYGVMIWDGTLP